MKIAVIIVTYNAMPWHDKSFAPFSKKHSNGKVYIIDNGSTDGTQGFIKKNYPDFIFYQSKTNLGFGKANNIGLKMALEDGCTNFLLLNQDAVISWASIENLVDIQSNNIEFGILSPLQLFDEMYVDKLHLSSLSKSGLSLFNDYLTGNFIKDIYKIDFTNAAIWLISKECLKKVGGFDPIFPHYGEDFEYTQRANYFGYSVGICPNVHGFHFRNQTTTREMTDKMYFVKYLIDIKNYKNKVLKVLIIYLIRLSTYPIKYFHSFKLRDYLSKWQAYIKILSKLKMILNNRDINLITPYCFLDFDESKIRTKLHNENLLI